MYCTPEVGYTTVGALDFYTAVVPNPTGGVYADVITNVQGGTAGGIVPPLKYRNAIMTGCFNVIALNERARLESYSLPVTAAETSETGTYDISDEHTSELQSQFHLVCRLLLEKKK